MSVQSLLSSISGCDWPAVPSKAASAIIGQLYQLEQTEWLTVKELREQQLNQLSALLRYALKHSPYYSKKFSFQKRTPFEKFPLLTRQDLQSTDISCQTVPSDHLPFYTAQTSGSTGHIVSVKRTALNNLLWMALTMREHFWHKRNPAKTLAVVRANASVQMDEMLAQKEGWGAPYTILSKTGPGYFQTFAMSIQQQADWLSKVKPHYLLSYPSNLAGLFQEFEKRGQLPERLEEVRCIGETVSPEFRTTCQKLGLKVSDVYSSQEVGVIAIQCPVSGLYHIQSESLIVEVLNDSNMPCKEGEIGRVVITDLHNFATPLIRYEILDYAQVGGRCPCGRGLPTLSAILGRRRNLIIMPDGSKRWPTVGFLKFREVAPIIQYQLIQHSLEKVEVRLVVSDKLSTLQEQQLSGIMHEALGHPFSLEFKCFEKELPRTKGGKFEEFISYL